jgi:very-long-chain enoyl-CoA reductase
MCPPRILSGVLLSGAINIPSLSASALKGTVQDSDAFLIGCTAVWALAEAGNAWAHIKLRNLRPPGTRERNIPRGGLFDFVSCANYFYEFLAWTAYTALTLSPASALFAAVSTGQMGACRLTDGRRCVLTPVSSAIWALGKHKVRRGT